MADTKKYLKCPTGEYNGDIMAWLEDDVACQLLYGHKLMVTRIALPALMVMWVRLYIGNNRCLVANVSYKVDPSIQDVETWSDYATNAAKKALREIKKQMHTGDEKKILKIEAEPYICNKDGRLSKVSDYATAYDDVKGDLVCSRPFWFAFGAIVSAIIGIVIRLVA